VDVGSGTGILVATILAACDPAVVYGIDSADAFLGMARQQIDDPRARWERGDATDLPWEAETSDVTVSGLVLNFVRDPERMVREKIRVTRAGGIVAGYVWDYAEGMQMMRYFWDVAKEVSPQDAWLDQAERHPLCRPGALVELFEESGLKAVEVRGVDIPTIFESFEDYWEPFLGGTGAAPSYLARIGPDVGEQIRQRLQERLPVNRNGRIELRARAWFVRGNV
jgi:trans-aconitate methyltransferase